MLRIIFILSLVLLFGCATKLPYCIGKGSENLKLSWGILYPSKNTYEKFVLTTDRKIKFFTPEKKENTVRKLSEEEYCNLLDKIQKTILQTQVINEIGDTLNFVEYESPEKNVIVRAIWNPRFKTKNSIHFRKLFDTLEVITFRRLN